MKFNHPLAAILVIFALAMICMSILIKSTGEPYSAKGAFKRQDIITVLKMIEVYSNPDLQILDLCGATKFSLFFYTTKLRTILRTDKNLTNPKAIKLDIDSAILNSLPDTLLTTISIDSPFITIFLHNSSSVLSGSLNGKIKDLYKIKTKFNNALALSRSSLLTKRFDSSGSNLIFSKINLETNDYLDETNITDRLNDGGFGTDGKLSFEATHELAVYTYFYINKIEVFDTNLSIKYHFNSIDTCAHYQTSASRLINNNKENGFSFDRPPKVVNDWSVVKNNNLYLISHVRSDNEDDQLFTNNSVMDVYDLANGLYLRSFYIPRYLGERCWRFSIDEGKLLAFYPNVVISYWLDQPSY